MQELLDNDRTKYIAPELVRIAEKRLEAEAMMTDPDMVNLAQDELAKLDEQEESIKTQILDILEKKIEEEVGSKREEREKRKKK